jgi:DNA invertase Pin-like site-specific DNA recombinase
MATGKWISYLRVSTNKQGAHGLGIDAQRNSVETYLNGGRWTLLKEFVEVESGAKSDNRPQLAEAIRMCRLHRAKLIIARLDRLSRDAHFLLGLEKAGVEFVCCDNPHMTRLTVGIVGLVAEEERRLISVRIKDALAAAKARGKKLGGDRGYRPDDASQANARRAMKSKADARAADVLPSINALRASGRTSLRAIARGLNEQGISTPRGKQWDAPQVRNVLARSRA